ncbi:MAG TPA: SDR family oxidoreductase [Pyrinomonadaceae bacterium]|jgi:NAD(P)-dependent dehydrogenase (short-subunit alcohol dehydrogenase family)|nr:SDR family oxidoreductase [Pyrinomonadaceae bacterium]
MAIDLSKKIAIVTGGTKGIGRAIAQSLVDAGASVAITARNQDEITKAVSQINRRSRGMAKGYVCDVRDYNQVKSLFAEVGTVDILINNAGVGIFSSVESMSVEDFRTVLETNVFGVFYCCHEAIPLMKQRGGGYIINISSLAGANAHPQMAAYNASKFGLNGFSEALMQEVRHDGIKVSYIMPGSVNTEFGGDETSDEKSWQLQPSDIAQVVIDLLQYPERTLPSRVEIRPARPPKR